MGSPMVFQTAPPQPASKARRTWSAQFAGGPEASQNGLGDWILPAKRILRSAILSLQPIRDSDGRALAPGDGVHDFTPAVDAVAAGEIARVGALSGLRIGGHAAVFQIDAAALQQIDQLGLSDRDDHRIARYDEIRTGDRREIGVRAHAFDR